MTIFRTSILENASWWQLLYIFQALLFQNTSTCLLLSSLCSRAVFFSKKFYSKNHLKEHVPLFLLPRWKKIPALPFIMFSWLLFMPTLFKIFLYWQNLKILISLTLSQGEESYLSPPYTLGNIQPIHLKIDLEAIHDYEINFLPWRDGLFSCYPQTIAIFSIFILYQ